MGHLALLFSVCLFASPLSVLTSVLAERSSELLPPVNCFLGLFLGWGGGTQEGVAS